MNMISRLRQAVQQYGKAEITVADFNQLQSEWITRVGADELLATEREAFIALQAHCLKLFARLVEVDPVGAKALMDEMPQPVVPQS